MAICELLDTMLATSGNMTVVIRNMERDGLISRTPHPEDKRVCVISLTDKGEELIGQVLPEHFRNVGKIFSVLSKEDQKDLVRILKKFKNL